MNRDRTPADWLSGYVGVDITDAKQLCRLFARMAADHERLPPQSDRLITTRVYGKYVRLYELSCLLVQALHAVLDDAEHKLVMEEARGLGYRLPDIALMHRELDAYKNFLEDTDPYNALPACRQDLVRLPRATADMLVNLTDHNCFMVARIFDGCFNTDYMKHFGFLKRSGFHYTGATALQETLNVLMTMLDIKAEIDHMQARGRGNGPDRGPKAPRP